VEVIDIGESTVPEAVIVAVIGVGAMPSFFCAYVVQVENIAMRRNTDNNILFIF
jgi:hypothetical protein